MFWALVRKQHFVVTREQLLALGFTDKWIKHRLASGKLHRASHGVYTVGRPDLSRDGLFMAAVLGCGPSAAISHAHAAEVLRIGPQAPGELEVSVLGSRHGPKGIVVRRRKEFASTRVRQIPVTTVSQTLVDLAPRQTRDEREAMLGQADQRRLTNPARLRKALDKMPRQPGLKILKQTLDRRDFVMTHTELERRFVPLAFDAGYGKPITQRWVGTNRVDFIWTELELVAEVDGLTYHRTAAQQAKDIVAMNEYAGSGFQTVRFTHEQVRYEPDYVRDALRRVLLARTPRAHPFLG